MGQKGNLERRPSWVRAGGIGLSNPKKTAAGILNAEPGMDGRESWVRGSRGIERKLGRGTSCVLESDEREKILLLRRNNVLRIQNSGMRDKS